MDYWYSKYLGNKVPREVNSETNYAWIVYNETPYLIYESCTLTKNRQLRWYMYIKIDGKFKRITHDNMYFRGKRIKYVCLKDIRERYPEFLL